MRSSLTTTVLALGLLSPVLAARAAVIYTNDFNGPLGTAYSEWSSSPVTYTSTGNPPGSGTLPAPAVRNIASPNNAQRFLGEFGGPQIGLPTDPGYNHTRVDQTISLSLSNLPAHAALEVAFDLYILKSWDGDSPKFGRDRFTLSVTGGRTLLDTTFSNNPKTNTDLSYQDYPARNSPPWSGAFSTNTLGYSGFFYDGIYRLRYAFAHGGSNVTVNFSSSLFEGKGTADESWGLDNVGVATVLPPVTTLYTNGLVEITWETLTNVSYQVQWAPAADTNNWSNLGAPIAGTGSNVSILDSTSGRRQRHYRAVESP